METLYNIRLNRPDTGYQKMPDIRSIPSWVSFPRFLVMGNPNLMSDQRLYANGGH